MKVWQIKDLFEDREGQLGITHIAGKAGLVKEISHLPLQRLGGNNVSPDVVIPESLPIITPSYRAKLLASPSQARERFLQSLIMLRVPSVALSETYFPPEFLLSFAESQSIPLLSSMYDEYLLESRLIGLVREKMENVVFIHGALVNMYGLGVIITGDSGAGKTECAIRLVGKGHLWIADDVIEIEKRGGNRLWGRSHHLSVNLLERKEGGIVDAKDIFDERSIRRETRINLMIHLENAGISTRKGETLSMGDPHEIMGVSLPCMSISVTPRMRFPERQIDESVRYCLMQGGNA